MHIATFEECIYVLHAFVKKSATGVSTSKHDRALIDERYSEAKRRHIEFVKGKEETK